MNCPDQQGRVILVTGGYGGVGFELCKILYARNATLYVAGRSQSKAEKGISMIKEAYPDSSGRIESLYLDLSDLDTIKPAAESFKAQQDRLDVLVNNAGVMYPPEGSVDAQGHDLQIGTNCLGPYLLYQFLLSALKRTAASSPTGSVRVAWGASIAVHVASPGPHGMNVVDDTGCPKDEGVSGNYGQAKVGNVFLARHFAKSTPENGVVHVAFNSGNLRTGLQRNWSGFNAWMTDKLIFYSPAYGGYTELWAAIALEVTPDKSGSYVYPWGRFGSLPRGLEDAMKGEEHGGSGVAAKFIQWCRR